jgi:hypothetical protein
VDLQDLQALIVQFQDQLVLQAQQVQPVHKVLQVHKVHKVFKVLPVLLELLVLLAHKDPPVRQALHLT